MKRQIQSIPLNLIKLDQENVRFGGDIAQNQREAIDLMMADPEDGKKLLKLAEHIAEHGLDPTELQLVTPCGEGYFIVLEGNRRLTALKLLQKPDLCPDEKLVKRFIEARNKWNGDFPIEIECSVVPSRSAGDMWIELKHTGQNGGVGRLNWDSDIRDERRARQTGVESIGRQIRNIIKENPLIFSPYTVNDIFAIPVTTLTRLFSSIPAQEVFQIKVENKELKPLLPLEYIAPSVDFAINLFKNEGYNVNDIRSDDDRKRFVRYIPQELHPLEIFSASREKNTSDTSSFPAESVLSPENENSALTEEGDAEQQQKNTENINNRTSPAKTKAKPSSRARKYLLPWSLNISANRINEIYRELRHKLEVNDCPNATAIAFRVFIEISCDDFARQQSQAGSPIIREDNKKEITNDDKLSTKVKAVIQHLEKQEKITKSQSKTMCKRANTHDTVGSIDHFNLFIHSSAASPVPSELKDIADEYKPMLEAIWK